MKESLWVRDSRILVPTEPMISQFDERGNAYQDGVVSFASLLVIRL